MDSDIGSELGDSGVESAREGSGEEPSTLSGERQLRTRRVRVARRWIDLHRNLENDWRKGGRQIPILLDTDAHLSNGNLIALKILVDTGAQVNLIKEKVVARQFFRSAENRVKLITAKNSNLEGVPMS